MRKWTGSPSTCDHSPQCCTRPCSERRGYPCSYTVCLVQTLTTIPAHCRSFLKKTLNPRLAATGRPNASAPLMQWYGSSGYLPAGQGFEVIVANITARLVHASVPGRNFASKPCAIGAFGCHGSNGSTSRYGATNTLAITRQSVRSQARVQFIEAWRTALDQGMWPRIKMLVYFDLKSTSITEELLPHYSRLVSSPFFTVNDAAPGQDSSRATRVGLRSLNDTPSQAPQSMEGRRLTQEHFPPSPFTDLVGRISQVFPQSALRVRDRKCECLRRNRASSVRIAKPAACYMAKSDLFHTLCWCFYDWMCLYNTCIE